MDAKEEKKDQSILKGSLKSNDSKWPSIKFFAK